MNTQPIPSTPPEDQFRDDVLPPFKAYMSDKGVNWKAKCAAYAVAHFTEHAWLYYRHHDPSKVYGATGENGVEKYVRALAEDKSCQELRIIWDLALANKHRILTRHAEERMVTTSTAATVATVDRLWMNDLRRYFDEVLKKAVDFWARELGVSLDNL